MSPYIFRPCAEISGRMFRKNKAITGIEVEGSQYKLPQYADDTTVFSKCFFAKSLNGCLHEIEYFAHFSGLNVNSEKN